MFAGAMRTGLMMAHGGALRLQSLWVAEPGILLHQTRIASGGRSRKTPLRAQHE
jgi:hypothetical protein